MTHMLVLLTARGRSGGDEMRKHHPVKIKKEN